MLLFDGVCNLCNAVVKFVLKRDAHARFRFAAMQSEAGQALLLRCGLPVRRFDSFVLIDRGAVYTASTAGLRVLRMLGGVWKLFYGLMVVPRPLRDFVYNVVAMNRYRVFGKRDVCMVPTAELRERFL